MIMGNPRIGIKPSRLQTLVMNIFGKSLTGLVVGIFEKLHAFQVYLVIEPFLMKYLVNWESASMRFACRLQGRNMIDIGACYGVYEALLKDNFDMIWAFEPDPDNFQVLQQRFAKRRPIGGIRWGNVIIGNTEGVVPINWAVAGKSDKDCETNFYINPIHSGGHSLVENFNGFTDDVIKIRTISLNDFVDMEVDLIKVDAEGAEFDILRGAEQKMQYIDSWLIELHELERKVELQTLLSNYGYNLEWIDERHIYAWK